MDITMKAMEMTKHSPSMMNKDMTHKDMMHRVLSGQGESRGMMSPSHFPPNNPMTAKGEKIIASMRKQYGGKKGKQVFYASANAKKITG